jgi:RNase H-fold protein (predicted Holliday junction resolvase)
MQRLIVGDKEFEVSDKLTVAQWMEISQLDITKTSDQAKAVCIVFGMPVSMSRLLTDDIVSVGMLLVSDQLVPKVTRYKTSINNHKLIDFNSITLGKFVDLEVYIDRGRGKSLDAIVSLLYDATDTEYWYIDEVLGAVIAYDRFRQQLFNSYKKLFSGSSNQDDDYRPDVGRMWYDVIMTLADGKFNLIEQTTERPVIEAFNWLAWNKDRIRQQ